MGLELCSTLLGWLATAVSLSIWMLMLIVVCIGGAGALFIRVQSHTAREQAARLTQMNTELASNNLLCTQLKESNKSLKQEIDIMVESETAKAPVLSRADLHVLAFLANLENKRISATKEVLLGCNLERLHPMLFLMILCEIILSEGIWPLVSIFTFSLPKADLFTWRNSTMLTIGYKRS